MEAVPLLIQNLPEHQILREDDHFSRSCAYLQVHPCNFKFDNYDHGTPAQKERYKITKPLFRYFNKRHFLFSRFENGVAIDQESWYSVIPEAVSLHLRQRMLQAGIKKIFEPFSGVGGIAIHLCDYFEEYIVNDIDPNKLRMLKHNMKIYQKSINRLKFINSDFLKVEPFETDALLICPPWGGIHTDQYATTDPDELMKPKLSDILIHAQKFCSNIMLQMPKQTNIDKLIEVFRRVGLTPIFTVEKIMTNSKCSQLFFYLGNEQFQQIERCQLYNHLYRDLGSQSKEQKRKAKTALRNNPQGVLMTIFQTKYPNKKKNLLDDQCQTHRND